MEEKYKIKINDYVYSKWEEKYKIFFDIDLHKIDKISEFINEYEIKILFTDDENCIYDLDNKDKAKTIIKMHCVTGSSLYFNIEESKAFLFKLRFSQ